MKAGTLVVGADGGRIGEWVGLRNDKIPAIVVQRYNAPNPTLIIPFEAIEEVMVSGAFSDMF